MPVDARRTPQARSLGLYEQRPPARSKILEGCVGSLSSYSRTLVGCRLDICDVPDEQRPPARSKILEGCARLAWFV